MMKISRLRRAGDVTKISGSELPKIIMSFNPEKKRRVGKPEVKWTDVVHNVVRKPGVRNLRMEGKGRDGGQRIREEAKAHLGI